tara:strand:+ start:9866 stop:10153 length:288 start_codon:yes stop_codon:yes gene_type:complete
VKTTNAIEKALQGKINEEVSVIVENFIADLNKLSDKYGGSSFYDFTESNASDARTFMVSGTTKVKNVLHRMILDNHGDAMLRQKSKELINKLDLV